MSRTKQLLNPPLARVAEPIPSPACFLREQPPVEPVGPHAPDPYWDGEPYVEKPLRDEDLPNLAAYFAWETGYYAASVLARPSGWYREQVGGEALCTALQALRLRGFAAECCRRQAALRDARVSLLEQPLRLHTPAEPDPKADGREADPDGWDAERRKLVQDVETYNEDLNGAALIVLLVMLAVIAFTAADWARHHVEDRAAAARPAATDVERGR